MSGKKIAPSILSANFSCLGDEISKVTAAGSDWIHVDVMDGHFVPNLTIGIPVVKSLRAFSSLPLDVHLMISNPIDFIDPFAAAGASAISVHVEATPHIDRAIERIKSHKLLAGVALNPATSLYVVDHLMEKVDFILLMTVNPGFGGQTFIDGCLHKIEVLKKKIERLGLKTLIEVDGGVTLDNIGRISDAGADIFVAGTAIFQSKDYKATIAQMRQAIAS